MVRSVLSVLIVAMAIMHSHQRSPVPPGYEEAIETQLPDPEPAILPKPQIDPPRPEIVGPRPELIILRRCLRPNEVWNACGGCEPTCEIPKPTFCTKQCRIGCQCKRGYFRRRDGACVRCRACGDIILEQQTYSFAEASR